MCPLVRPVAFLNQVEQNIQRFAHGATRPAHVVLAALLRRTAAWLLSDCRFFCRRTAAA
jgi:hypothetical protein